MLIAEQTIIIKKHEEFKKIIQPIISTGRTVVECIKKFKTRSTQKCVFMSPKISAVFSHSSAAGEMSVHFTKNLSLKQIRTSQTSTRQTSSESQSDMKICPETECPFFTKPVSGAGVAVTKQSLQHQAHCYIIN